MAKTKELLATGALRAGNTIATPLRVVGEGGNAVANIFRQGQSSAKNVAEVGRQTIDALVDNFLNFSKVEGKRYQRFLKGTVNLTSAVTRRPAMITGAGMLSGLNQGVRKPFQKLLYTPGKMFKGMRNATRIFSKKKGFDFAQYDTHETGGDTRVNQFKEKKRGFFGVKKGGSAEVSLQKKAEEQPKKEDKKPEKSKEEKQVEEKKVEEKKVPAQAIESPKKTENPDAESKKFEKAIKEKDDAFIDKELEERGFPTGGTLGETKKGSEQPKPKSMDELKNRYKEESQAKLNAEIEAKKRKNLSTKDKEMHQKQFEKMLENNFTEEGVLARSKKNKKGNNLDEVLKILDKENPTFATFIDDEILAKKTPAKTT